MLERRPHIAVQEAEYVRLLGYPRHHTMTGRARELADWAQRWYAENGRPWIYARSTETLCLLGEGFSIDGIAFGAKQLQKQLIDAQAHAVMLVAVSAGTACEEKARQLWLEEKPDEYFFLEVYGSAVVEYLITRAGARFCAWADRQGVAILPHCSPGYPEWDIAEQGRLLQLIQAQDEEAMPAELHVLETGMLRPKKSLLAVFGITAHVERVQRLTDLVPCGRCPMQACQFRRTPYNDARRPIEEVRELSATWNAGHGVSLNHQATYSVSIKALRKWSRERLQLTILEDNSVQARFRFEGTTCSNLGRPMVFEYRISLDGPENAYRIMDASCTPIPGDEGYTSMCMYLKDAGALMAAIETEKPLLGKPLDDVLTWQRRFSPAGCYCDAASRAHKWGLTLEVVHYALTQVEKQQRRPLKDPNALEFQP